MLSHKPKAITNAGNSASYYLKQDGYYFKQMDEQSYTSWEGKGAEELGLEGKVVEKDLFQVLEGRTPDGKALVNQKPDRRCGWEICWNLPKSVSMAILIDKDEKLLDAVRSIPQEMVKMIQKECAQSKKTVKGETIFENTDHLICAVMEHITSKRNDPNLHYHLVFPNLTKDSMGQWRAMASSMQKNAYGEVQGFSERLFSDSIFLGTIACQLLAEKAIDLGYCIEPTGKNGLWELTCYSKDARDFFSTASKEINAGMKSFGDDPSDPKMRDLLNKMLREKYPSLKKKKHLTEELHMLWKHQRDENGFQYTSPDSNRIKPPDRKKQILASIAVHNAIDYLSHYRTRFSYTDVLKEAVIHSMGKTSVHALTQAFEQLQQQKKVIPLERSSRTYVTEAMKQQEYQLKKNAHQRIQQSSKRETKVSIPSENIATMINQEKDSLLIIEHRKNPMPCYEQIHELSMGKGEKVLFLTQNAQGAVALKEDLQQAEKNSRNYGSFLRRLQRAVKNEKTFEVKSVQSFLYNKPSKDYASIVIDNVDKCNIDALSKLMKATKNNNQTLICFQKKHKTLTNTAGLPTDTLKESGIKTLSLSSERSKEQKDFSPELHEIKEKQDCLVAMAKIAVNEQAPCLMMTRQSKETITPLIREELMKSQTLSRHSIEIESYQPVFLSDYHKKLATFYKKGQICRTFSSKEKCFVDREITWVDRKNNRLHFDGEHPPCDLNKKQSFQLIEKKNMDIREGEKLITLSKCYTLGAKTGQSLYVKKITPTHINYSIGKSCYRVHHAAFHKAPINYNYAQQMNNSNYRQHKALCVELPYHASNKGHMDRIQEKLKPNGKCMIFTDDAKKTQRRFSTEFKRETIGQSILSAAHQPTQHHDRSSVEQATQQLHARANLSDAEKIVDLTVEKITSREASFSMLGLINETIKTSRQSNTPIQLSEIKATIDRKLTEGELIQGKTFITTQKMLQCEQSIVHQINEGKGIASPLQRNSGFTNATQLTLTHDQSQCISKLLQSKDQFMCIQGFAGTGKTTVLNVFQENLPKNITLRGIAPTKQAVTEMLNAGMKAQTMQSWIIEMEKSPENLKNAVIVLDEASMVDNSNFEKLITLVRENQGRLILAGDRYQHPSIRAGKPYILAQDHSKIDVIQMKEAIRPKTDFMKSVYQDLQQEKYSKAIEKVQKAVDSNWVDLAIEKNDSTALDNIAKTFSNVYLNLSPKLRDEVCAIAPAHCLRDAIHPYIREGLKKEGVLDKSDVRCQTLMTQRKTPDEMRNISTYQMIDVIRMGGKYLNVDHSTIDYASKSVMIEDAAGNREPFFPEKMKEDAPMAFYQKKTLPFAAGDEIRLTESATSKNRIPNAVYRVTDMSEHTLTAAPKAGGDAITLNTKDYKDQHIDYAYTSTSQLAQGMTKTLSLTAQLAMFKHLATTQALNINFTRATERIIAICDNSASYSQLLHDGEKTSALQTVGHIDSRIALATIEKKCVPHYAALYERLFDEKPKIQGISSTRAGDFLLHFDADQKKIQWSKLSTNSHGEGLLSYIAAKEKMPAKEMQIYGLTILADAQEKQTIIKSEKQTQQTKPLPKYAQKILSESQSIENTKAETYFKKVFEIDQLPDSQSFRFHERVFCSEDRCYYPAMLVVGKDGQENPSQLTAVFLNNTTDNDIDNNSAIEALHEKTWGDENMHSSIQVHLGDDNVSLVTHTLESAMILQQAQPQSSIIAIDDINRLSPMQLNQNVVLCIEASLVNDPATQANLISTIETLEACGKHVLINYLPSHECSGEMHGSIAELVQDKGMEGLKELLDDVRSLDSVMGEVGDVEKSMSDELDEINKTADHHSMEEEKSLNNDHQIDSREQDFEMEL